MIDHPTLSFLEFFLNLGNAQNYKLSDLFYT